MTPASTVPGASTLSETTVATTTPETTTPDAVEPNAPDSNAEASTTVAETVPEPTVAPTTTIAATDAPTTVSTEYFIGGEPDGWLYLGRWTGNAWETDRTDEQVLRESTLVVGDVNISEVDVAPITGAATGTAEACADGRLGPVIAPNARAPQIPGFGYRSIAFPADWSTQPRPVVLVDASIDTYLAVGRAAFADLDVDTTDGVISQLVVSDLDGDGDTEALVAFDGSGFSALLLIDADSGTSLTMARSVATTAAPAEDGEAESAAIPNDTFRVLAVADLNGDAQFEIVTHAFEGATAKVTVNVYDGTEVTPALTAGC